MTIELIVGDGKPLSNAAVPVRWCINKQTLNKISKEGGEYDAQVLVIALDDKGHESRMIAPMDQGMGYINLNRSGINKLYCMVIYSNTTTTRNYIEMVFLSKEGTFSYSKELEFKEGVAHCYTGSDYSTIYGESHSTVDIPKELFGKEPPEWLKNLVNTWQYAHIDDQCAWRRRFLFFITVKLWAMLLYCGAVYLFHTIFSTLYVLFGYKPSELDLRWVKHPIDVSSDYSIEVYNHITCNKHGDGVNIWKIPLVPIVWIGSVYLALLFNSSVYGMVITMMCLLSIVPVSLLILVSCVNIVDNLNIDLFRSLWKRIADKFNKKRERLIARDRLAASSKYRESEDYLSCNSCDNIASIALVPRKNMTIRLRYEHIKNSICKPMMR